MYEIDHLRRRHAEAMAALVVDMRDGSRRLRREKSLLDRRFRRLRRQWTQALPRPVARPSLWARGLALLLALLIVLI